MNVSLTDTKAKRLTVIVVVAVVVIAAGTGWFQFAGRRAQEKADDLRAAVSTQVAATSYEDASDALDRWQLDEEPDIFQTFTVSGVEPELLGDVKGKAIRLQWRTGALGRKVCIVASWEQGVAPTITEHDCSPGARQ